MPSLATCLQDVTPYSKSSGTEMRLIFPSAHIGTPREPRHDPYSCTAQDRPDILSPGQGIAADGRSPLSDLARVRSVRVDFQDTGHIRAMKPHPVLRLVQLFSVRSK